MTLQAPIQPYEQPPASRREPCDQGANAPEESHRAPRRCRAGTPRKFLGAWTSHIRPRKSVSPCVDTPRLQSSSRGEGIAVAYYVRIATRGSAATGSPRQALNYITDGHDARRDPSYSDAELHYIARMDPGWKTDLEGGRVPLVGFGELAGENDEEKLAKRFEDSCQPYHSLRGTTGYKSITLTLPKEVSLYAEGHREEAKAAINAAIKRTLDRAFAGFRYSGVAAIHTRNEAGEIHYHAHVLVGKFARSIETGRAVSLNSTAGKNYPEIGRASCRERV